MLPSTGAVPKRLPTARRSLTPQHQPSLPRTTASRQPTLPPPLPNIFTTNEKGAIRRIQQLPAADQLGRWIEKITAVENTIRTRLASGRPDRTGAGQIKDENLKAQLQFFQSRYTDTFAIVTHTTDLRRQTRSASPSENRHPLNPFQPSLPSIPRPQSANLNETFTAYPHYDSPTLPYVASSQPSAIYQNLPPQIVITPADPSFTPNQSEARALSPQTEHQGQAIFPGDFQSLLNFNANDTEFNILRPRRSPSLPELTTEDTQQAIRDLSYLGIPLGIPKSRIRNTVSSNIPFPFPSTPEPQPFEQPGGATALSPTAHVTQFQPSIPFSTSTPRPQQTERVYSSAERLFHGLRDIALRNLTLQEAVRQNQQGSFSESSATSIPLNSTSAHHWDDELSTAHISPNLLLGAEALSPTAAPQQQHSIPVEPAVADRRVSFHISSDESGEEILVIENHQIDPPTPPEQPAEPAHHNQEEEASTETPSDSLITEEESEANSIDSQDEEAYVQYLVEMEEIMRRLAVSHEQATQTLVDNLRDMGANSAKQQIPYFSGKLGEQTVHEWFEKADRVAQAEGWNNQRRLRIFQERLTKPASCYNETIPEATRADYAAWRAAFITGFSDEATKNRWKNELEKMKQDPNERVRDFAARINQMYLQVHGPGPANNQQVDVQTLREDTKKKIFLNGLRRDVYNNIWSRIAPETNWHDVVTTATTVEAVIEKKQILDERPELDTAVATVIKENAKLTQDIEKISNQLEKLMTLSSKQAKEELVAAFDDNRRDGSRPRVRFSNDATNRDRSRSRDTAKSPSRSNDSRNSSPSPRHEELRRRTPRDYQAPYSRPPSYYPSNQGNRYFQGNRSAPYRGRPQFRGRSQPPSFFLRRNNRPSYNHRNSGPDNSNPSTIICHHCNKPGHMQRECRSRLREMAATMSARQPGPQPFIQTSQI